MLVLHWLLQQQNPQQAESVHEQPGCSCTGQRSAADVAQVLPFPCLSCHLTANHRHMPIMHDVV
jgi:hypothetical protein